MNSAKPSMHPGLLGALLALGLLTALPAQEVFAGQPCCTIVAIQKAKGIVTLRDNKTGKLEKVTVKSFDIEKRKLTVGKAVDRSIGVTWNGSGGGVDPD